MAPESTSSSRAGVPIAYLSMLFGAGGLFLVVQSLGERLVPPEPTGRIFGAQPAAAAADALLHVLVLLVVVIVVAKLAGIVFRRFNQPPVIGEVIAGIILGPSFLGRVAPDVSAFLLPPAIAPHIGILAQVGVILYMFLVGLELDTGLLKSRTHASIAVSHASIVTPFVLGCFLALWLYPRFSSRDVPFTVFALFIGVSMSVTAFPVLARILTDRGMHRGRMGTIALACAAVDDVTAWCLLAFVVSVVQSEPGRIVLTVSLTGLFILAMLTIVRPAALRLVRMHAERGRLTQGTFALVFIALFLSAVSTELIGIHALFGAFLLGAVVPHDSALARELSGKLEHLVVVVLLPAFFAFTGMRTQIGLVQGLEQWLVCLAIIAVASIGKFGGSTVAARLTGLPWRQSLGLGVLMNTRGLMELIVLNVGLDLEVISPVLFAMLVLMAIATTVATTPLLHWLGLDGDETAQARHELKNDQNVVALR